MKVVALCASVFAAALLSFGFSIAHAREQQRPAIVCVVGDLEIGPDLPTKTIYKAPNVEILIHETDAECQLLTSGGSK